MTRKRNIVARTPRALKVIFPPAPRTIESFHAAMKAFKRWPQLDRAFRAYYQSKNAQEGARTEREYVSLLAWTVLVDAHGEMTMLSTRLTLEFLTDCADALEASMVPAPRGAADGWYNERMRRVRDLIRRNRKRLQTPR